MMKFIDARLSRTTMYLLMLYYAAGLLGVSFVLGFFKLVPIDPTALAFSGLLVTGTCWLTNRLFAHVLRVPVNAESVHITAFLLILIMQPVTASQHAGVAGLLLASVVAIASKFLLAIGRKHVFNPVALGVVASGLVLNQPASWWIGGNLVMLPFVLAGGVLVLRKLQRFDMMGAYVIANIALTLATSGGGYGDDLTQAVLYSPLLFLGFTMLTDPLTAPQAKWPRLAYGALVGALSCPSLHVGSFYLTPEIALLAGNVLAYATNPKSSFRFTLLRIEKMAADCYDYVFAVDRRLVFEAGQYLYWTLDVSQPDNRGNRRAFTIASAPNSDEIRLGVKFYAGSSAFKTRLAAMQPGEQIHGSQLAGSFTLPRDPEQKLAFIAGGIGITPFRSMVEDMLNRRDSRSVIMLYGTSRLADIAYSDVFSEAEQDLGLRTRYIVADETSSHPQVRQGMIDGALIAQEIPDFRDRVFYISGPNAMVSQIRQTLSRMGVARTSIKVDFFPGLA
ncbi:MAG: RnfABCDGE type electron transport complex subunit D [Hyphomicrobiales bacterium]|nr:RnfABCDGE type electron transport complex subunit D [Hyphomicrobiales bacterium]